MGYVDENLLQGEEVVYRARLHPIIFGGPIFLGVVGILFSVVGLANKDVVFFAGLGVFFILVAALFTLARYVRLMTSEFAVTNKRVLVKTGLIQRHTLELLLSKVETVGVDQGVFGRIFKYGTIIVTGTGGTKEPFKGIRDPLEFRKQVQSRSSA